MTSVSTKRGLASNVLTSSTCLEGVHGHKMDYESPFCMTSIS